MEGAGKKFLRKSGTTQTSKIPEHKCAEGSEASVSSYIKPNLVSGPGLTGKPCWPQL